MSRIIEFGLHNTSTHEIARAAKVSRGAMLHHFPTRADLLEAVFGYVLKTEAAEIKRFSETVATDGSMLECLIRFVWTRYQGPLFLITLDYLALARTDDATMRAVVPSAERYNEELDSLWTRSLLSLDVPVDEKIAAMTDTMFFLRGMAFQCIWRQEPSHFERALKRWIPELHRRLGLSCR